MLPVFAKDILLTGPWGLGLLRSAPAVGALMMSLWLARFSVDRHVGRVMFTAVGVFGVTTIAFGLSTSFWFSLAVLVVLLLAGISLCIGVVPLSWHSLLAAAADDLQSKLDAAQPEAAPTPAPAPAAEPQPDLNADLDSLLAAATAELEAKGGQHVQPRLYPARHPSLHHRHGKAHAGWRATGALHKEFSQLSHYSSTIHSTL